MVDSLVSTLMSSDHGPRSTVLVLASAVGAAALLGAWFPRSPEPLQSWDQATHLLLAAGYHDAWAREGIPAWHRLREVSSFYPPFYHVCVAALFPLVGPSARAAGLVGGAMLVALAVATAGIARRLYGTPADAVAAAFVLASPSFAALAAQPLVDLTLAALVAVTVWCTLTPRVLASWPRATGFGLLLGCGLLTKWVFPAFVAAPIVVLALRRPRARPRAWLVAAATAAVAAGTWYVPNAQELAAQARVSSAAGQAEGDPSGLALDSLTYYPEAAVLFFPWPVRILLVTAGLAAPIAWLRRRMRTRRPPEDARPRDGAPSAAWLLGGWIAVPLVLFTAIDNKDPRYIAAAAPVLAIVAARALAAIPAPSLRTAVVAVTCAYAAILHVVNARARDPLAVLVGVLGRVTWISDRVGLDAQSFAVADSRGWPVRDVVARIGDGLTSVSPRAWLAVVPDLPYVNAATFQWAARQAGYELQAFHPDRTPTRAEYSVWEYALVKPEGLQGTHHATLASAELAADVMARPEVLVPVWAYASPDGPLLLVRTRHGFPPPDLRPRDGTIDLRSEGAFWHLGPGWSFQEPWGRWAIDGHAVLRVTLPAGRAGRAIVSMTPPESLGGGQLVTARFRGRRLRSVWLDRPAWDWEDVALEIPAGLATGGIDELSLTFARSVPAGGPDAARSLSAAVRSVRFESDP